MTVYTGEFKQQLVLFIEILYEGEILKYVSRYIHRVTVWMEEEQKMKPIKSARLFL